jgi:hypothetical protein
MRLMTDDYIMNVTSIPIWSEWSSIVEPVVVLKFLSLFLIVIRREYVFKS